MKRFFLVFVMIFSLLVASPVMAQEGSTARPGGFGIGLGQGTLASGLSGKMHTGPTAFQGVVGCWGYGYGYSCRTLGLSLDILINMPIFVDADVVQLGWNIGGGASLGVGELFAVGGQFVAGLEFIFPSIPIDLVLEYRPTIGFRNYSDHPLYFHLFSFGGHVRFYF